MTIVPPAFSPSDLCLFIAFGSITIVMLWKHSRLDAAYIPVQQLGGISMRHLDIVENEGKLTMWFF